MCKYRRAFMGEFIGTFLVVLFGCGSVAVSVLFDAYQGLPQVGLMWGIGVTLAIYASRHLSCAHFNPAVTIAMVFNKRMKAKYVPIYLMAQFLGAFVAGLTIYGLFASIIVEYESANEMIRGAPESMLVAKMFGEYYNLPGSSFYISMPLAMLAEGAGTFLLVLMILSLTDGCNLGKPDKAQAPVFIGLSVSSVICLVGPVTQAGLNPARDFAPRMVAWIFGWGEAAFPDNCGGFFFVYILAPILGGILAGSFFTKILQKLMKTRTEDDAHCN